MNVTWKIQSIGNFLIDVKPFNKVVIILISIAMSIKMDAITEHSSQSEDNLNFMLQKQPHRLRKISDFYDEGQKSNFCFTHESQSFTVTRAYMNSLNDASTRLYYTKFSPKQKIGAMCVIHGYGQSSDDYIETASYFAKRGYTVHLIDLRGFGYSGGYRVNNPISGSMSDISALLTRCCQNGVPTYILCHGFGCLLVMALLQENPNLPLAGVIALSPLFSFPNQQKSSWLHQIALALSPSIMDDILINNMINPTGLTNNPIKIKKIITGVFNYQYVTLKMLKQYNLLAQKVKRDAVKFNYPILMCVGSCDFVQSHFQADKWMEEVSSKEREIVTFDHGYHQLYNDVYAEDMFKHIQTWICNDSARKNRILWNSAKVLKMKTNFLYNKNYVKKIILFLIGSILALIAIVKKLSKCKAFLKAF